MRIEIFPICKPTQEFSLLLRSARNLFSSVSLSPMPSRKTRALPISDVRSTTNSKAIPHASVERGRHAQNTRILGVCGFDRDHHRRDDIRVAFLRPVRISQAASERPLSKSRHRIGAIEQSRDPRREVNVRARLMSVQFRALRNLNVLCGIDGGYPE
jgi:hypothetical protein